MEEAKKSKRPRIGAAGMNIGASENADNDSRYEKVNYPVDSSNTSEEGRESEQRSYQQRPYSGYNQNRTQGGYNRAGGYNNQGGYQPRNNYGQGGYNQNRTQGGYGQNRQQGGYNQNRTQGGNGQPRQPGGYHQNRHPRG